ncbi:hypothetical protein [Pseudomonas putida]|uniref:hypothetical protein n=1 Tax=Pseudomonas putida TaxID=303 RepID=UPI000646CFE2|nr:hypothetical protein [Pseudomonas putida]
MDVTLIQHPVGQGGMFSGELKAGRSTLRWVFDCGSNQQDRLKEEIRYVADQGSIDLLFLSHLDSDHVNGVDRLLALTTVDEVVLPYLNAADFAFAVAEDISASALSGSFLDFVIDPSRWLIARGVRTVSFVRAVADIPPMPEWPMQEPYEKPIDQDENHSLDWDWSQPAVRTKIVKSATVRDIASGASIGVSENGSRIEWLLAPFAHKPSKQRMDAFQNALEAAFGKRLSRSSIVRHARNEQGRATLKECYGALWSDHNKVSLSLYAGPPVSPSISTLQLPFSQWHTRAPARAMTEIGWLMTGDAELASGRRTAAFIKYYQNYLDRVGVLVLPHHGSVLSFNLSHLHSFRNLNACIVAAGPNQYGHPDPYVFDYVTRIMGTHGWHHVSECPTSGFGVRAVI